MSAGLFIGVAYAATCIYLGFWLGRQLERKAWEQRLCSHRWEHRSLDNLDHFWQKVCLICGDYVKLEREDVPYHIRAQCKDFRG